MCLCASRRIPLDLPDGVRQVTSLGVGLWLYSYVLRIYLILEWCCTAPLAVVPGRAAPALGVEIDADVSYAYQKLLFMGC